MDDTGEIRELSGRALVRRVAWLILSSLMACTAGRSNTPARHEATLLPDAYRTLGNEISTARGLAFTRRLDVHVLGTSDYHDQLSELLESPPSDVGAPDFRYAFGFSRLDPLAVWFAGLLPSRRNDMLAHEQIIGFYAPRARALYVRGGGTDVQMADTITHELAHAVVDDHTDMLRRLGKGIDDVDLARRALVEGDAIITTVVVKARRAGRDVDEAIRKATLEARVESLSSLEGLPVPVSAEQLAKTNPLDRARFLFPYQSGAYFVGQLWRAGGPAAVDSALAAPPESTEQILDPERYLMGDKPVEVDLPKLPPGWTERASGRMGELKTRIFLSQWMPFDEAIEASKGWGGDLYVVGGRSGGDQIVIWATAWDDQGSAAAFERALQKTTACEHKMPCLRGPTKIRRDGIRVAYVRGVADEALLARAIAGIHEPSALKPPFETLLTLRPLWTPKPPELRSQEERTCVSRRASVRLSAPDGFVFANAGDDDPCNIVRPATGENVKIFVIDAPPIQATFDALRRSTRSTLRDAHLLAEEEAATRLTPLGYARVMRYRFGNGGVVEISFVSICGGSKTLQIITRSATEFGRASIAQALSSLRPASVELQGDCGGAP
jgi:hypothetical protein